MTRHTRFAILTHSSPRCALDEPALGRANPRHSAARARSPPGRPDGQGRAAPRHRAATAMPRPPSRLPAVLLPAILPELWLSPVLRLRYYGYRTTTTRVLPRFLRPVLLGRLRLRRRLWIRRMDTATAPYGQYPYPPYYYPVLRQHRLGAAAGHAAQHPGLHRRLLRRRRRQLRRQSAAPERRGRRARAAAVPRGLPAVHAEGALPARRHAKITHAMQPLGPGESSGAAAQAGRVAARPSRPTAPMAVERQGPPPRAGRPSEFGSLLLRVRPADADILVDGERGPRRRARTSS